MPTILQLRRGTENQNTAYTGAPGELTFDTSLSTIRVHDGDVAGGHRLALYSEVLAAGLDSGQVINIVDSAYIQARQADIFRDSDFVTGIVDTVYIQARDRVRDSSFITGLIDSAFIQERQAFSLYGDSNVTLLVDSAYIQARQVDIYRDSGFVTTIVDSAYVQERVGGAGFDSALVIDLITANVTSTYINNLEVSADSLDGLDGTAFVRSDVNDTKSGNLTFDTDALLQLGTSGQVQLVYNSSTSTGQIKMTTNEELQIRANVLNLQSRSGETYLNAIANGGIQLRYDNQARLKIEDQGVTIVGNILPQFGGFYSLGSSDKRWKDLWVTGNTIYLGSISMSVDSSGTFALASIDSDGNTVSELGNLDPKNLDNAINVDLDSTSQQVLDTFEIDEYRTARYIIQMEKDSDNKYHSTEILLMHNNTNVYMTEYAVLRTDSALGDITADLVGNTVRLLVTPSYNSTSIKAKRLIIDA